MTTLTHSVAVSIESRSDKLARLKSEVATSTAGIEALVIQKYQSDAKLLQHEDHLEDRYDASKGYMMEMERRLQKDLRIMKELYEKNVQAVEKAFQDDLAVKYKATEYGSASLLEAKALEENIISDIDARIQTAKLQTETLTAEYFDLHNDLA